MWKSILDEKERVCQVGPPLISNQVNQIIDILGGNNLFLIAKRRVADCVRLISLLSFEQKQKQKQK